MELFSSSSKTKNNDFSRRVVPSSSLLRWVVVSDQVILFSSNTNFCSTVVPNFVQMRVLLLSIKKTLITYSTNVKYLLLLSLD